MKKLFLLLAISSIGFSHTIEQIQGTTHKTVKEGETVENVKGVITLKLNTKYNNGFFMQSEENDNDKRTSAGIYVENKTGQDVKIGDLVEVDGVAKEIYFGKPNPVDQTMTSIHSSNVKVLDSNVK